MWLRCPSHGSARWDDIMDTSRQISILSSSTIQRRIMMRDWKYAASEGLSSGEMPISGLYDVLRGVSAFTGSYHQSPDCLETYASMFLKAELTYWDELKSQALTSFLSSTCLVYPTRYNLGGLMDFSLSSKYQPRYLHSTCQELSLMTSVSPVYKRINSQ